MNDEQNEDRPWTEEEWERLLRSSELRAARFEELFETLENHPDRDRIIAEEMGWDPELLCEDPEQDAAEEFEEELEPDEEWEEEDRRQQAALESMPAYAEAQDWSAKAYSSLRTFLEAAEEVDADDPLAIACCHPHIVPAKLCAGHSMGYDDDVLCGNIVYCKRALKAARESVAAMEQLAESGTVPEHLILPLIEQGNRVIRLVEEHIAELRARVWWE
jgi:hypothetical protein